MLDLHISWSPFAGEPRPPAQRQPWGQHVAGGQQLGGRRGAAVGAEGGARAPARLLAGADRRRRRAPRAQPRRLQDRLHPAPGTQGRGQRERQRVEGVGEGTQQAGVALREHIHAEEDGAAAAVEAAAVRPPEALPEVRAGGEVSPDGSNGKQWRESLQVQGRGAEPPGAPEDAAQGAPQREEAQQ